MKHFLAYWKYKDWLETRNEKPAYHSDAEILKEITPGSELWLFTRITKNPKKKTIHVVQKIKIKSFSSAPVTKKKKFVVVGEGLADSKSIEATKKAINGDDKKDCWLEVLSRIETVLGKVLKSKTAGEFTQRVQSPREIASDSAALLAKGWEDHFG